MESIRSIYKIGLGPSSSHTMGPKFAAELFLIRNSQAGSFRVTLYGSLAATGKGHLTDAAIVKTLYPYPVEIVWEPKVFLPDHPNGMKFEAIDEAGNVTGSQVFFSIGGGEIVEEGCTRKENVRMYDLSTMQDILAWCEQKGRTYWEYVLEKEGEGIWLYLADVWDMMKAAVQRGLENEGVLPGGLGLQRKAAAYHIKAAGYKASLKSRALVYAYALAVSEENASGGEVVTAPTCGSSGVLPGVLYHLYKSYEFPDSKIHKALATAGLIADIVKTNASISGAQVGCQGEIGVACAMTAAAANQLFGGSVAQIEYAAEMGLEHHLGLTCDPVCGLVQIPCIERNAFAAVRALDANLYSTLSDGVHRISFDKVVETMRQTGHDLPSLYKETSEGGLARQLGRV
ncbi:MAG: L-serine ammonia-lyase [Bacteroidales bacterium]|jgi:L-serine dehydratase|nr:L-serine ammonia-lyase [Bacteroidales bacterium]